MTNTANGCDGLASGLVDGTGAGDGEGQVFGVGARDDSPHPVDLIGLNPSMVAIHLGMTGSSPFLGRFRD